VDWSRSDNDGRNIDPTLGRLEGEAADQESLSDRAGTEGSPPYDVWPAPASTDGDRFRRPTYYDRPVLKEPVWKWYVPAYFYCGGLSGASAALAAVAHAAHADAFDGLVRRARWVAALAGAAGTAFLIVDLGRPRRFLNMLRVFRPSSPMSVGSWIVAGEGPLAAGAALLSGSNGLLGAVGDAAGAGAGGLGSLMTGYTAVLLANTAVPIWQRSRRALPPLFVASAISSAGSMLELLRLDDTEATVVRRFAVAGRVAEITASFALEREAGKVEEVAKPLHEGRAGSYWKAAKILALASLGASLLSRRWRALRTVSGLLGTAGAVALRFAVAEAGAQSAADPHATFTAQRRGFGAAEVTREGPASSPAL
jgi:formate-dependent nitrite reductase membrane component NrfD